MARNIHCIHPTAIYDVQNASVQLYYVVNLTRIIMRYGIVGSVYSTYPHDTQTCFHLFVKCDKHNQCCT